jgi:hypothetical protein
VDKIVMTLLVRRDPESSTRRPVYAVQMAFPKKVTSGEVTSCASVRLIKDGIRSSMFPSTDFHPRDWRAATLAEQADFAASFGGNPQPWHCVMHRLSRDVFDYPDAGDKSTNNGQVWEERGFSAKVLKTERRLALRCQEERDALWNGRLSRSGRKPSATEWIQDRLFSKEGPWIGS